MIQTIIVNSNEKSEVVRKLSQVISKKIEDFTLDSFSYLQLVGTNNVKIPSPKEVQNEITRIVELEQIDIEPPTLKKLIEDAKISLDSLEVHLPFYTESPKANTSEYKQIIANMTASMKALPPYIKLLENLQKMHKKELAPLEIGRLLTGEIKKQDEKLKLLLRDPEKNKEDISLVNNFIKKLKGQEQLVSKHVLLLDLLENRAIRNLSKDRTERVKDLDAARVLIEMKKANYGSFTFSIGEEKRDVSCTEQFQKAYELIRKHPELGNKILDYYAQIERLNKLSSGGYKSSDRFVEEVVKGEASKIKKFVDDEIFALSSHSSYILRTSKHTWRMGDKNAFQPVFDIVRKDLDKLSLGNEFKALTERIKKNPTPENIEDFVAFVEKNSEFLKYDIPGWEGNNYYNPFRISVVDGKKCFQGGCVAEAEVTAYMLGYLKEKEILPKEVAFHLSYMGLHWALIVFKDSKDPGFIIDRWIAEPGSKKSVFRTQSDWVYGAGSFMREEKEKIGKEQNELLPFFSLKDKSGWRKDADIIEDWAKKNEVSYYRLHSKLSKKDSVVEDQDFITFKYFLGSNVLLPRSTVTPKFFEGVRLKVAACLGMYGIAKKDDVMNCADLNQLEKYLKLYFVHFYPNSPAMKKRYPDWESVLKNNPKTKSN